jgi:hypothetical protein
VLWARRLIGRGIILDLSVQTFKFRPNSKHFLFGSLDRYAGVIGKAGAGLGDGGIHRAIVETRCDFGHETSPFSEENLFGSILCHAFGGLPRDRRQRARQGTPAHIPPGVVACRKARIVPIQNEEIGEV